MTPLALKWLGVGAVLLVLSGLVAWLVHDLKAAGAAEVRIAQEKQHAKDVSAAAAETRRIDTDQLAAAREADKFRLQARADARSLVGASERVQHRFDALNAGCVSDASSAPAGSVPASSAADLRSYMFSRVREAAKGIGGFADESRAAGIQAQQSYPVKP